MKSFTCVDVLTLIDDIEVGNAQDKINIEEIYSYTCQANHGKESTSAPNTPLKQPSKKVKANHKSKTNQGKPLMMNQHWATTTQS